ncbi:MAG: hypothetical protein ABIU97_03090 [Dehalococcoidia bacterium]
MNITSWSHRDIDDGLALVLSTPTPSPTPVPVTPTPVATEVPFIVPLAPPDPTPPPAPPPIGIAGPRVLAVGESVMLGATPGLVNTIPNLEIAAAISRHVAQDIEVLRYRRDTGTLGDVVVLHIGKTGSSARANLPRSWTSSPVLRASSG